jgi:lipoate-protein ligase A
VVGYGNKVAAEVNTGYCESQGIPVLRRCSGGGTVLQGPGCFNYSLVLPIDLSPMLGGITSTNEFVLTRHQAALRALLGQPVEWRGQTDLSIGDRKFSGNAQRRRKRYLLFHGTFLLSMDLGQIAAALRFPSKQPDYRANRSHPEFLVNLEVPAAAIQSTLEQVWRVSDRLDKAPKAQLARLMGDRYGRGDWHRRL